MDWTWNSDEKLCKQNTRQETLGKQLLGMRREWNYNINMELYQYYLTISVVLGISDVSFTTFQELALLPSSDNCAWNIIIIIINFLHYSIANFRAFVAANYEGMLARLNIVFQHFIPGGDILMSKRRPFPFQWMYLETKLVVPTYSILLVHG
jgi:hypothetical protein